jgi:hypothetical protein
MKILGVEFNKNGVSNINITHVIDRIGKSINIWRGVNLNMIEKIVVCKTFILSKMWYKANFILFSKANIKAIDFMIHKFIWSGAIEMIKRDTVILPYECGGLNSVSIKARFETILIKNFINTILKKERMFYQLSVKYMKFNLREYEIKNFNIIPTVTNNKRPNIYNEMSLRVKDYKIIDPLFKEKINKIKSKEVYNNCIKKYIKAPKIENIFIFNNWTHVYKQKHSVSDDSDLRERSNSYLLKIKRYETHIFKDMNNYKQDPP